MRGTVLLLTACHAATDGGSGKGEVLHTGETAAPLDAPWSERCDPLAETLARTLDAGGASGGALAVVLDGEILCAGGVGVRGPDDPTAVDAATLFRAGELTRLLTNLAVLRLIDQDECEFDMPITGAVPDFEFTLDPTWASQIRVGHLLNQTSGLYALDEVAGDQGDDALASFVNDVYGARYWRTAEPGLWWNPSAPADALLGELIERRYGRYYRQAMSEAVFEPLAMDRTGFLGLDVQSDGNYAWGYGRDWTGASADWVQVGPTSYDNAWARPSAYAWSDALDLARLARFLLEGDEDVLSDATRRELISSQADTLLCPDQPRYGYGISIYNPITLAGQQVDLRVLHQHGDLPGYTADLYLAPDARLGLVVLGGADDLDAAPLALEALRTFVPDLAEATAPPDWSPALPGDPTGTFHDVYGVGAIRVEAGAYGLNATVPLLDLAGTPYEARMPRACDDGYTLTLDGEAMRATLLRDALGEVVAMRTRRFVAVKE